MPKYNTCPICGATLDHGEQCDCCKPKKSLPSEAGTSPRREGKGIHNMFNKVIVEGRLTDNPELRNTTTGKSVVSFTLASERSAVNDSETKITDFIDCVAWLGTAEYICRYYKKGQLVFVAGQLETRKYTDRYGKVTKKCEVNVSEISFSGAKEEETVPKPSPELLLDELCKAINA